MELNTEETIKAYKALTPEARWDKMYEAAEGFINKEGKLPPTDYQANGVTLINWIRSHSSTNQKNEEKRNKVKKILADSGVLSTRDHWDTYFPMLKEHLDTKIPLRYSTDKKFQEWARDLKRRWHDENIDETKRNVLVEADYEYLIVEEMLTYELLKEFYHSCDDIELYTFNNDYDDVENDSMEMIEDTFDILSFLKRELVKRDNNELSDKKIKVLSLFDKFDLKMTSSQKVIKEIIKDELQKPFVMKSIDPALRQVYQLSVDTVLERTKNDHFKMLIHILDSKNQTEIAGMCGLTKERVRQLFNIVKDQFKVDLKNNVKLFKSAKI